jgi:hypothetical protein
MKLITLAVALAAITINVIAQQPNPPPKFKLALPDHHGLLSWTAEGFKVTEASAKPKGQEIGVRSEDATGHIHSLGFLFRAPEFAPLTSAKCRDAVLASDAKDNPSLKVLHVSEIARTSGPSIALANYTAQGPRGAGYLLRGFIATGDMCGDLEFDSTEPMSDVPISEQDRAMAKIFSTFAFDPNYLPAFADVFQYAQVLYQTANYGAAAPLFEKALAIVPVDGAPFPSGKIARRVATDQAGMAYGIAGNATKARSIFTAGIARDPEYPLYYYNLACADAEEKNLKDAQRHLQQAFARKANVNPGESMPDPTADDSFIPYKSNKEFWDFITNLRGGTATETPSTGP